MNDARLGDRSASYADPVRQLLTLGEIEGFDPDEWPDYPAAFGLGPAHIDALIRMGCDAALLDADMACSEAWAPMHAWRALAQLRAEAAVAPLLAVTAAYEEEHVLDPELPTIFGLIGPAALPHIAGFVLDPANAISPVSTAISGLTEIAGRHPDCRAEVIDILVRVLEAPAGSDPTILGFAVSALLDLEAIEAIDAIRGAFRREAVDLSIAGDLQDVEVELGLRSKRVKPAPALIPRAAASGRAKIGRNDPCPCGSGKKYKKCCLP